MVIKESKSIAQLSFSGDFGGREKVALLLSLGIEETSSKSFSYFFIEKRAGVSRNEHLLSALQSASRGLRLYDTYSLFSYSLLKKIAGQLVADEIDVAHCHCYKSLCYILLVRFLGLWRGVVCFTLHGLILRTGFRSALIRFGQNIGIRIADGIIGCSREVLESSVSSDCNKEQRVLINAIDSKFMSFREVEERKDEARAELLLRFGLPSDAFLVINVGRLTPQKNFSLFLQLIEYRLKNNTLENCHFFIVGNGELYEELMDEAESRLVTEQISFTGFVDDMEAFYLGADLLVQTSHWEGTPMCLLEARSYGLPAIVPDVGGNSNVLCNESDGFIYQDGDMVQLDSLLSKYIQSGELRSKHGRRALEDTLDRFGVAEWIQQHLQFYEQLLVKFKHGN